MGILQSESVRIGAALNGAWSGTTGGIPGSEEERVMVIMNGCKGRRGEEREEGREKEEMAA